MADTGNPHAVTANQTTPMNAKGQLEGHDGAQLVVLPPGVPGQVLKADSAAASGLAWGGAVEAGQQCGPGEYVAGFNADGSLVCLLVMPPQLITTVDSVTSNFSSIAIGTDGLPIISYHDRQNDDLKVARCRAVDCNASDGFSLVVLDDGGGADVGWRTSLAIGTDGLPVITYKDDQRNLLMVARCHLVGCFLTPAGSGVTFATVASGAHSSITIGTDSLPVISYSGFNLTVAHCANRACVP